MEWINLNKPRPRQLIGKEITTLVLVALLIASLWFLFGTEAGAKLRDNPRALGSDVRQLVHRHALIAPLVYLGVYTLTAVTALLPVWWLQLLAGIGFGLYEGTFVSLIGSTLATGITVVMARWLAADWFHERVEAKLEKLRRLDETLGHNGFLFVMTARLIPFIPFGVFNYALGLTKVSVLDAVLGTLLGAMPIIALHVGVGAGYHPWHNWRFDLILTSITAVLLTPLILRYLWPQWFKKIGVE